MNTFPLLPLVLAALVTVVVPARAGGTEPAPS